MLRRYARHLVLPEIGEEGQRRLLGASILVIGAGGLGSGVIGYLAAAGVGRIGVVESDRVELSNLQRQILFETADIGCLKAEAARDRAEEINPDCRIDTFCYRLDAENAQALVRTADIVIDGSDNFATRFAVAEACMRESKTLVSAAISGFSAQLSTFKPFLGYPHPCYHCLVPVMPEQEMSCAQEGVIGPLAGVMASLQALEAIKELLGIGESLSGRLLIYDALACSFRHVRLLRDPQCPVCTNMGKPLAIKAGAD